MIVDPETLPRRERERLARRQAMLDAARAVFAEKGYEQATLDEVAERAEFGKGTLYNYFEGGKEGILQALFEELFDNIEAIVVAHVERSHNRPVHDLFYHLLVDLIRHYEQDRDTFLLIIKEVQRAMLTTGGSFERMVWERDNRIVALMQVPISQAIEAGRLRPFPPQAIARTVLGNMHGLLMHTYCAPESSLKAEPEESIAERAAHFITAVLFDGLRPRD